MQARPCSREGGSDRIESGKLRDVLNFLRRGAGPPSGLSATDSCSNRDSFCTKGLQRLIHHTLGLAALHVDVRVAARLAVARVVASTVIGRWR